MLYKTLTLGLMELDEEPKRQVVAGLVLLITAVPMLIISIYKTYRFCIKYTLREYLQDRRAAKYELEHADEIEYVDENGNVRRL